MSEPAGQPGTAIGRLEAPLINCLNPAAAPVSGGKRTTGLELESKTSRIMREVGITDYARHQQLRKQIRPQQPPRPLLVTRFATTIRATLSPGGANRASRGGVVRVAR